MSAPLLARLMGRLVPRDGASAVLEEAATGLNPLALDAALATTPPEGRRDRALSEADTLLDTIGQKVLHGWLQNRQQTSLPLTLNLRGVSAEGQTGLAGLLASTLLADRPTPALGTEAMRCRSWLASVGALPDTLAAFDAALACPPGLSRILEQLTMLDLAAYAYVAGLMATDPRSPAGQRFLLYLEARLDLPTALVRSAIRRYGR